jgi:hypothetical protein
MDKIILVIEFLAISIMLGMSFSIIGSAVVRIFSPKISVDYGLSAYLTIGIAFCTVFGGIIAQLNIGQKYFIFGILIISLIYSGIEKNSVKKLINFEYLNYIIYALLISLIIITPAIIIAGYKLFSMGNQDVFYYILHSEHLLRNGYSDPGIYFNYHLGRWALSDWAGSKIYLSQSIALVGGNVTKAAWPAFFVVVFAGISNILIFTNNVIGGQKNKLLLFIVAVIVFCSPLNIHATGNYFLAQYIEFCYISAIAMYLFNNKHDSDINLTIGLLAGAGIITYPHMLVITILMLYLSLYCMKLINLKNISIQILISIILAGGLLLGMLDMGLMVGGVLAGWPLPGLNIFSMFYNQESLYNNQTIFAGVFSDVIFVGLGLLLIALLFLARKHGNFKFVVVFTSMIFLILFFLGFNGTEKYKFWKSLVFFMPFLMVPIYLLISRITLNKSNIFIDNYLYFLALALALVIFTYYSSYLSWKNNPYFITANQDLVEIENCVMRNHPTSIYFDLQNQLQAQTASVLFSGVPKTHGSSSLNWPILLPTNQVITTSDNVLKYQGYVEQCRSNEIVFLIK